MTTPVPMDLAFGHALSDAALMLAGIALAVRTWRVQSGISWAMAVIALAAACGTARFAGVAVLAGPHDFFSLLASVAAVPLLAFSLRWPDSLVASDRRAGALWLIFAGAIAVLVQVTAMLPPATLAAVLSLPAALALLLLVRHALQARRPRVLLAVGLLVLAFACTLLPPADWPRLSVQGLHYLLATGLLLLCWRRAEPAEANREAAPVSNAEQTVLK